MPHRSANEKSVARRVRPALLATAAVLLPALIAGAAFAQSGAQPREIPKGFVLPGPAPTGMPSQAPATGAPSANPQAAPKSAPEARAVGNADNTSAREGRPMDFAKAPEAGKTNWPCVQQKLGSIQPAQVWAGPPLSNAATEKLTLQENRVDRSARCPPSLHRRGRDDGEGLCRPAAGGPARGHCDADHGGSPQPVERRGATR